MNPQNLPPQPQQFEQPIHQPHHLLLFPLIIVCIVVLFIGLLGGFYLGKKQINQPVRKNIIPTITKYLLPTITPVQTAIQDETVNWKTYTNQSLGFSFQYPDNYFIYQEESTSGIYMAPSKGLGGNGPKFLQNTDLWLEVGDETPVDLPPGTPTTPVLIDGLNGQIYLNSAPAVAGNVVINSYLAWVTENNRLYTISLSSWNKTTIINSKKTFDQILSTFKFLDQTTNSDSKTYTSKSLGLSFNYLQNNNSGFEKITIKELNNKICVTYDENDIDCTKGQFVEIFQKSPSDTIEQAITKQFLNGYSSSDCFPTTSTHYTDLGYPANYEVAIISFPKSTDSSAPWWQNGDKCPHPYTEENGITYFLYDKNHANKFLFFNIGQYAIDAGNNKTWNQTIQFNN